MKRMAMLILALMLTVLPVAALGEGESTVTVYGYGKTYVTLDTAVITFEISASAKTVQEARKQHDQKLVPAVGTLLQKFQNLLMLCRTDISFFLFQIAIE